MVSVAAGMAGGMMPVAFRASSVAFCVAFCVGLERLRSAEWGRAIVDAVLWGIPAAALYILIESVRFVVYDDYYGLTYYFFSAAIVTVVGALVGFGIAAGFAPWGRLRTISRTPYPWRASVSVVAITVLAATAPLVGVGRGGFSGTMLGIVGTLSVLAFSIRAYRWLQQRVASEGGQA